MIYSVIVVTGEGNAFPKILELSACWRSDRLMRFASWVKSPVEVGTLFPFAETDTTKVITIKHTNVVIATIFRLFFFKAIQPPNKFLI